MKFCPHCGAKIKDDVKFCTNCGQPVAAAPTTPTSQPTTAPTQAPTTPAANSEQMQQLQAHAKNYWGWLVATWKHPLGKVAGEHFFSWISFGLEALFLAGTMISLCNRFLSKADNAQSYISISKLSFGNDIKIFLLFVLILAFYLFIGYGTSALGSRGTKIGLLDYLDRYARLTNYVLIINLVLWLSVFLVNLDGNVSSLFHALTFTFILLIIGWLAWQVALVYSINQSLNEPAIDHVYLVMIATLLVSLLLYMVFKTMGQDIFASMLGSLSNLEDSFSSLFGS